MIQVTQIEDEVEDMPAEEIEARLAQAAAILGIDKEIFRAAVNGTKSLGECS